MSAEKNKNIAYSEIYLGRDKFREGTFVRDGHKCVVCGKPAADAHHILERRLWPDGGYYLDNGASVCADHHMQCETTEISVEEIRAACGIQTILVPPDMYKDRLYDKWGNIIMSDGRRTRGPMVDDESVRKVLARGGKLDLITPYVSYPRTYHLPWSPGATKDDRVLQDMSHFEGQEVVVTVKMDGENFTGYSDGYSHARAVDGRKFETQNWIRNFWNQRAFDLPHWWRVSAENLWATHSIRYDDLPNFIMGFSVWNENNVCLSWEDTLTWLALLDIPPVPVLYKGAFDRRVIEGLFDDIRDWDRMEGYVMRVAGSFHYRDFNRVVAKYVRRGHCATVPHGGAGRRHWQMNGLAATSS